MKIEQIPVGKLKPAEYNPRKFTPSAVSMVKTSIERFGIVDPIIVNSSKNRKNIVIGGHLRLFVAKELGIEEVPVVFVKIDDIERERELNLRLNKNVGEFDFDLLSDFDEDMLKDVGFSSDELDVIFDINKQSTKDPDDAPDTRATKIKEGDKYRLGTHILLCADSTKEESYKELLKKNKADMVFTDPPYNVNYTGGMGAKSKNSREGIMNDNMSKASFLAFLIDVCQNVNKFCTGGIYICMSSSELDTLKQAFETAGGHWQSFVIWVKNHFTLTRADYQHLYEPILYGWPKGIKNHYFTKHRDIGNVWEDLTKVKRTFENGKTTISFSGFEVTIPGDVKEGTIKRKNQKVDIWRHDKPTKSEQHPTMKPVALCEQAISNSSQRGGLVLDPFCGSGSTLIACERLNRRCFAMELDPKYCQVIIDRWEEYTESKAEKL